MRFKKIKIVLVVHEFWMHLRFKMVLMVRLYSLTHHRESRNIFPYRLKTPLQPSFLNLRMHSAYILFDHVCIYIYLFCLTMCVCIYIYRQILVSPSWTETDEINLYFKNSKTEKSIFWIPNFLNFLHKTETQLLSDWQFCDFWAAVNVY